jgi:hypothetical protein
VRTPGPPTSFSSSTSSPASRRLPDRSPVRRSATRPSHPVTSLSGSIVRSERRQRATAHIRAILYRYRLGIAGESVFHAIFGRLERFDDWAKHGHDSG